MNVTGWSDGCERNLHNLPDTALQKRQMNELPVCLRERDYAKTRSVVLDEHAKQCCGEHFAQYSQDYKRIHEAGLSSSSKQLYETLIYIFFSARSKFAQSSFRPCPWTLITFVSRQKVVTIDNDYQTCRAIHFSLASFASTWKLWQCAPYKLRLFTIRLYRFVGSEMKQETSETNDYHIFEILIIENRRFRAISSSSVVLSHDLSIGNEKPSNSNDSLLWFDVAELKNTIRLYIMTEHGFRISTDRNWVRTMLNRKR